MGGGRGCFDLKNTVVASGVEKVQVFRSPSKSFVFCLCFFFFLFKERLAMGERSSGIEGVLVCISQSVVYLWNM